LSLNDIVRSIFDGVREAKQDSLYPRKFMELEKTNLLFDVDDLEDMLDHAEDKEDYESILDHMYRFDATDGELGYYKGIEKKIIDRYWED
jgi:predicted TIM-barrel fold metal-dependent hydrolase